MAARARRLVSRRNSLECTGNKTPTSLPYGRGFVTLPETALAAKAADVRHYNYHKKSESVVEIYSKPGCKLTEKYAKTLNDNGFDVMQYVLGIDVDSEEILGREGVGDFDGAAPLVFVDGQFSAPLKTNDRAHIISAGNPNALPYGRSFARMLHTRVDGVSKTVPASNSKLSTRKFSRLSDARVKDQPAEKNTVRHARSSSVSLTSDLQFNSVASREQANKWLKEGQYAKAEEEYGRILRNNAGTYTTYSNRATARFFQSKYELAAQDASAVIDMEPTHVKGYLRLSSCLRAQKRFEDALSAIDKVIGSPLFESGSTCEGHLLQEREAIQDEMDTHDDRGFGYFFPEDGDPDVAWMLMKKKQPVQKVAVSTLSSDVKDASKLRVVCVSDTHGRHRALGKVPDGDVLVCAGDFTETGTLQEVEDFSAWLKELPHKHKIVIAGNHDLTFEPETYLDSWQNFHKTPQDPILAKEALEASGCVYLEDSSFEVEGLKFFGTPHQPEFNNWAFNSKRGSECRTKWDQIPRDTDVLISHGPPLGHGDAIGKKKKAGCVDLLHSVQQVVRPTVHIFGHVHEGYGATTDGETTYVNASVMSDDEWTVNKCIVVDIDKP